MKELEKGNILLGLKKEWGGAAVYKMLADTPSELKGFGWLVEVKLLGEHMRGLLVQSTSSVLNRRDVEVLIPWEGIGMVFRHPGLGTADTKKTIGFISEGMA
jgi:hypothetical protein